MIDRYRSTMRTALIASASAVTVAAVLAVSSGAPAHAQSGPREQRTPAIAWMTNPSAANASEELDTYFVAWIEDRGAGADVFGRQLFANGLPKGGPEKQGIQVIRETRSGPGSSDPPGERANPDLVWNATALELVLVYSEFTGEADGWDIFSVRLSPAGYSKGNPRKIVGGPGDQQRPDIALLDGSSGSGNDDFIVVYDDNTRDLDEIWAVRLRSNTIPKGEPFRLFAGETWNASDPTTSGGVVAWVDDRGPDTEIYAIRLRNGLPNGTDYRLAGTEDDDVNPNFGSGGLVWNTFDPATGDDIVGVQVYDNDRTRGPTIGIVVPAANQSWPVIANGLVIWSDDRVGNYDLYAMRTVNIRRLGREFPIQVDRP